ncbi:MAG: hypothetical protein EOO74_05160 [Myxococcales bacterium]|nr:MAG: hypothetical protein EOO74_05160 [Myxococcales bacterium]
MILDAEQLILGYPFIAARHGRIAVCDALAVHACCSRAHALAGGDPRLEPAAMFFSFADRRRAFPFAWKLMVDFVTRAQARVNHLSLEMPREELEALCVDVLYRRATWEMVRDRIVARLLPLTAP